MTSRGPLQLAALASAAVPGLDPDSVEGVVTDASHPFEVAFVQDDEHRRWVIRSPRTPAASAQLEQSAALLALLARRLTMPVPAVKGWVALPEGGRAAVTTYLTGRMVDLESIAPGTKLAAGLGRALAHLHSLDRRIYEEAGVPVYDADAYRARRLAELDRAAATGRVPTGLLTRWERTLEDVSLWRFTTTPTHGAIGPSTILATPDDGEEPDVKGFLGWEHAQVADPADDLAALVGALHPETLDTVLEAYAHARVERPDRHLQRRARLVHEMQLVRSMMHAVAAGDDVAAEGHASRLRRLDDELAAEEERAAAAAPTVPPQPAETQPTETQPAETQPAETQPIEMQPTGARPEPEDASADSEEDAVVVEGAGAPTPVTLPVADAERPPSPEDGEHETAEITPLGHDDEDDVVSPETQRS
ncbi:phosphotransferase [Janibacter terrae]|uniref:phosphotransferase n=1 Tax=Janibacter terrae TaxID=103817 RepID=UPI000A6925FA|nr:phosphotransferase [Janibacter terrae]